MIKFHQNYFNESITYDKVSPEKIRQNNQDFNNINNKKNKLKRFQTYHETEHPCKHNTPLYKKEMQKCLSNTKNVSTGTQETNN